MTKGAVIYEKGKPDVFKWEDIDVPDPRNNEVLIKNTAVGVNYIDTYHRRGMPHPWPVPDPVSYTHLTLPTIYSV